MKKYMKPIISIEEFETTDGMLVDSIQGLDGVTKGGGKFSGGDADSRRGYWDDEEE